MSAACRAVLRSKTAVTSTEISPLPHKILHSQAFAGAPFEIRTGGCKDECTEYAAVAHLVERHLAKVEVASSSLVGRSRMEQQSLFQYGPVAQLVRAPACHAGGRRFEPDPGRICLCSSVGRAGD